MTGRLIVVSNRIPENAVPSGGLVVALHEALIDLGGIWIGAHPDRATKPDQPAVDLPSHPAYRKLGLPITADEHAGHYLGYSNSVLWPLCHRRTDLVDLDSDHAATYRAVNRRMAHAVAELAGPDDMIWVHDYHFLPLATELRAIGVRARIGFFLHIPFPVADDLTVLPRRDNVAGWIAGYDLVGLQTQADVARCLEMVRAAPGAEILPDGRIKVGPRVAALRALPIGIDAKGFAHAAQAGDGHALAGIPSGVPLVVGVDRLDYTKGLPNRVRAFGTYLDRLPANTVRPTFLQITPRCRGDVRAYRQIRKEMERLTGRVNARHSDLGATPVRYIERGIPRDILAPVFRAARVGLVTPMIDGMNLVAKEYVSAQDMANPGVLILSRNAGAAEQMDAALLVNPYNVTGMAKALEEAMRMSLAERQARHGALAKVVFGGAVQDWASIFLDRLRQTERPLPIPRRWADSRGIAFDIAS